MVAFVLAFVFLFQRHGAVRQLKKMDYMNWGLNWGIAIAMRDFKAKPVQT